TSNENRWLRETFPDVGRALLVHEMLDDADRDARQIGEAFLKEGVARRGPQITDLERLELERLFGGEVVFADKLSDAPDELLVLEHQDLRVEDSRLVHASAILGLGTQLGELAAHVFERGAQAPHLFFDLRARHDAMRDLRQ